MLLFLPFLLFCASLAAVDILLSLGSVHCVVVGIVLVVFVDFVFVILVNDKIFFDGVRLILDVSLVLVLVLVLALVVVLVVCFC